MSIVLMNQIKRVSHENEKLEEQVKLLDEKLDDLSYKYLELSERLTGLENKRKRQKIDG